MKEKFITLFKNIALETSKLSTCNRASVGAVIVKNNQILATGYNGSPAKTDHCNEVGCYIENGHCVRTVHAEINAILQCSRYGTSTEGAYIFVTHMPCLACTQAIINAGIKKIFYINEYDASPLRKEQLEEAYIEVIKI